MYLMFIIVAGIGVVLAAASAITALVRSFAERKNAIHKPVISHGRR